MKVLVAAGSKYGSTRAIALKIGDELHALGFAVDVEDACDVLSLTAYEAVIVGSPIYGGLWRRDATELITSNIEELRQRDVWMFSVGITAVGNLYPDQDESDRLAEMVMPHELKKFAGSLDYDRLNMGERALVRDLNPRLGDFRDFGEISDWAHALGLRLRELALT